MGHPQLAICRNRDELEAETMKFNVNCWCRVKLTATGVEVLRRYHQPVVESFTQRDKPIPEFARVDRYAVGDMYETELWGIMHIFGPYLQVGDKIPFEMDIELKPRNKR